MMKEETYIQDWVQKYLDDQLSEAEKQEMDRRIETDQNLSEQVDAYKTLLGGLESLGAESFEKRLHAWEKKHSSGAGRTGMKPLRLNRYYAIAAVLLLLLLPFGYYLFVQSPSLTPDQLYAEYYAPYENLITDRDSEKLNLLEKGMSLYGEGKYEQAAEYLSSYSQEVPDDNRTYFYLGIIALQQQEWQKALTYFEKASADPLFKEQAKWYSGLTFMQLDRMTEAKDIFTQIAETQGPHYKKKEAANILKLLP